jgi:hypothetical protein
MCRVAHQSAGSAAAALGVATTAGGTADAKVELVLLSLPSCCSGAAVVEAWFDLMRGKRGCGGLVRAEMCDRIRSCRGQRQHNEVWECVCVYVCVRVCTHFVCGTY